MTRWRWDQGRLIYFKFDNLRLIATLLNNIDGIMLDGDPLRDHLVTGSGLPFAPNKYTVWRNYARVFGCSLLATRIEDRLTVTDICKNIAEDKDHSIDVDDYFSFLIPKFYFPSPVFKGYNTEEDQVFPFCAIIKLLLSRFDPNTESFLTLNDIFSLLIGNDVKGYEPLEFYKKLTHSGFIGKGDQIRQVREMLIFLSQFSVLKWRDNKLFLDLETDSIEPINFLEEIASPIPIERTGIRQSDLLRIGNVEGSITSSKIEALTGDLLKDHTFTEGKKIRVSHLKSERSPKLRRLFFESLPKPILCDACRINPSERYPWAPNIIEIHHLLPLGSCLSIDGRGVSFSDLVPTCSNCHKSIHSYYRLWLRDKAQDDFRSKTEAIDAYNEGKSMIIERL